MQDATLLIDIAVVLGAAFCGGILARWAHLPTIVGYLLAGIVIGPFTLGYVGNAHTIQQLADLGVIFLLFGVGLHISLRDLWAVRTVAVPGALAQMLLITVLGFALARVWGWTAAAGVVLGLAIAISSTVVLLRALMDRGLLNTTHGRIAVGWLVVEDLATVLMLVLLPALAPAASGGAGSVWQAVAVALLKAVLFAALMLIAGTRFAPWLLLRIAHMRSRELFILTVAALVVGTAVAATALFGVSLALGAFLAGVVVSESSTRHQVSAEVLPFRETFTVLFFVSVGMLVDPRHVAGAAGQVLALTALIVVGKSVLTVLSGFALPATARTMLVVAAGRSQIGEFSFILGQAGVMLGVLAPDQYSLILAGAVLSIMVNPFVFRALPRAEMLLRRAPRLWRLLDRYGPAPRPNTPSMSGHVVVVGYGRVGEHIVNVLGWLRLPRLVVELDIGRAAELERQAVPTLYGDAADSEVLDHAALDRARALVVTLPDEAAAEVIVASAHDQAPALPIIVRAATQVGVERLRRLGAREVIHPELEGGLEILRHTLARLGFPAGEVEDYANAVRRDRYDITLSSPGEREALDQLRRVPQAYALSWVRIEEDSPLIGRPLAVFSLDTARQTRIVAVLRDGQLLPRLDDTVRLRASDLVGILSVDEDAPGRHDLSVAAELAPQPALPPPVEADGTTGHGSR